MSDYEVVVRIPWPRPQQQQHHQQHFQQQQQLQWSQEDDEQLWSTIMAASQGHANPHVIDCQTHHSFSFGDVIHTSL